MVLVSIRFIVTDMVVENGELDWACSCGLTTTLMVIIIDVVMVYISAIDLTFVMSILMSGSFVITAVVKFALGCLCLMSVQAVSIFSGTVMMSVVTT